MAVRISPQEWERLKSQLPNPPSTPTGEVIIDIAPEESKPESDNTPSTTLTTEPNNTTSEHQLDNILMASAIIAFLLLAILFKW